MFAEEGQLALGFCQPIDLVSEAVALCPGDLSFPYQPSQLFLLAGHQLSVNRVERLFDNLVADRLRDLIRQYLKRLLVVLRDNLPRQVMDCGLAEQRALAVLASLVRLMEPLE